MDTYETQLAKQAAEQTKTLVDALLGPKIERLKSWSKERELEGHLKDENLERLLFDYVNRTIKKSSKLSTIVFPQTEVPLNEVYEPIYLHEEHMGSTILGSPSEEISLSEQLDFQSESKTYFIVDEAGMGKSTYVKYLSLKVVEEADRIPLVFELASYDNTASLIENLAREFDDVDRRFDRDLFRKLIAKGKLFIILDGFDEVPSAIQEDLASQIRELNEKKGGSSLLLTSRPQERFPSLLSCTMFKLQPLDKEQAVSILKNYDKFANLDIGENLIKELDSIPKKFLQNPLLVGLLYKTYGYNHSIAEKVSVFYSEIFEALYKGHDLTKSGLVREKKSDLDIDDFRHLLRVFSFLYVVKSSDSDNSIESIVSLASQAEEQCPFELPAPRLFIEDLLEAVPLLSRDGRAYKFMHRTLAEFFAAEYISSAGGNEELLHKIFTGNLYRNLMATVEFVYEINPILYKKVIVKPKAEEFVYYFEGSDYDPVIATDCFLQDSYILCLPEEDAFTTDSEGRRIPKLDSPEQLSDKQHIVMFTQGFCGERTYAVALAQSGTKRFIPDGAWLEITTNIEAREDLNEGESPNLKDFVDNLQLGTWYKSDAKEIMEISSSDSVRMLLSRGNSFGKRKAVNLLSGFRAITVNKCKEVIESVNKVSRAREDMESLLDNL